MQAIIRMNRKVITMIRLCFTEDIGVVVVAGMGTSHHAAAVSVYVICTVGFSVMSRPQLPTMKRTRGANQISVLNHLIPIVFLFTGKSYL